MKKIGVALGAGGAKGLSHIAFLQALDELGVRPAVIAGTSIGAVIGGFYAAGVSGNRLSQLVKDIGFRDLYKIVLDFSVLSQSAIFTGKGVEDFLSREIPVCTFEDTEIPLKVVATNFWDRRPVVFASGNLITAIRASMAMPAIFEPVILNDTVLIDGGAVNPLPYDLIGRSVISPLPLMSPAKRPAPGGTRSPIWWKASCPPSRSCKPPLWRPKSYSPHRTSTSNRP
jgi:NTE family protein